MKAGGALLECYARLYPLIADELERAQPNDWKASWTSVEMDERQAVGFFRALSSVPIAGA